MRSDIEHVLAEARCSGSVCVQGDDPNDEVAVHADSPVVAASVIKILIALAAESAFADGRLEATSPVLLSRGGRTPGPVGFSLFEDDVTASARDLVSAMLTISDNVAADALLDLVGLETCNQLARDLGLVGTVIVSDLAAMVDSIAQEAGFSDWEAMAAWSAGVPSAAEQRAVDRTVRAGTALDPARSTRTTSRDMCLLLRRIWSDEAGPPTACRRVRTHMGRQLTRNRLAAGFPPPNHVAAKSGGLMGVIRNEIGVVRTPDDRRFYVAIFTRADVGADGSLIDAAIGRAAVLAADGLGRRSVGDATVT